MWLELTAPHNCSLELQCFCSPSTSINPVPIPLINPLTVCRHLKCTCHKIQCLIEPKLPLLIPVSLCRKFLSVTPPLSDLRGWGWESRPARHLSKTELPPNKWLWSQGISGPYSGKAGSEIHATLRSHLWLALPWHQVNGDTELLWARFSPHRKWG